MFTFVLVLLTIVAVVGFFVPDKYVPKRRPRRPRRRHSESHGLPWMDPEYQNRKNRKRNSNTF